MFFNETIVFSLNPWTEENQLYQPSDLPPLQPNASNAVFTPAAMFSFHQELRFFPEKTVTPETFHQEVVGRKTAGCWGSNKRHGWGGLSEGPR